MSDTNNSIVPAATSAAISPPADSLSVAAASLLLSRTDSSAITSIGDSSTSSSSSSSSSSVIDPVSSPRIATPRSSLLSAAVSTSTSSPLLSRFEFHRTLRSNHGIKIKLATDHANSSGPIKRLIKIIDKTKLAHTEIEVWKVKAKMIDKISINVRETKGELFGFLFSELEVIEDEHCWYRVFPFVSPDFIDYFLQKRTHFKFISAAGATATTSSSTASSSPFSSSSTSSWPHFLSFDCIELYFVQLLAAVHHLHDTLNVCHLHINLDALRFDETQNAVFLDDLSECRSIPRDSTTGEEKPFIDVLAIPRLLNTNGEKTENLPQPLLSSSNSTAGSSALPVHNHMTFLSPELFSGEPFHGTSADLYSLSILLFVLFTGYFPFHVPSHSDPRFHFLHSSIPAIQNGALKKLFILWKCDYINDDAIELMENIMCVKENKRWNMKKIVESQFVKKAIQKIKQSGKTDVEKWFLKK